MAWARNGTPDTLSGTSDTLTISDLSGVKFNVLFSHTFASGGNTATYLYLNNDNVSGNYARRQSENGVADATRINQNDVIYDTAGDANDKFSITYIFGISSEEKLAIGFGINRNLTSASSVPHRGEFVWKWANTINTIDRVDDDTSAQTGTYAIGTNLSALTGDETETLPPNIQDGTIFEETDTNKAYIWNASTTTWSQL